jgi:hypothetical protein
LRSFHFHDSKFGRFLMSAGTRDFDSGRLHRADRDPPMPTGSNAAKKPDSERLRIVRADEPAYLTTQSLKNANKSLSESRRPAADALAKQRAAEQIEVEEELIAEAIPLREPGVDLGILRPKEVDIGKLAAFTHAVPAAKKDGAPATSGKAIAMPLAKTDLQQIFQTDQVCMVARPPEKITEKIPEIAPAKAAAPEPKREASPVSLPMTPPKKTPQVLDETQQYLVDNWPKLPPHVQAAILNVIDAAVSPDDE